MSTCETKEVPANALRINVGHFAIGDNGENAKTVPVELLARTGDAITHWFWGRVVHDLSGMKLHKSRLPIDYNHSGNEILGYLNRFDVTSGDLVCRGALTPFKDDDRASEVIYKAKNDVPYEASIDFSDEFEVLEVPEGFDIEVNGRTFAGPINVITSWGLRGVAICPYGADKNTESRFSKEEADTVSVKVKRYQLSGGQKMSKEENEAVDTADAVEATELTADAVEVTEMAEAEAVAEVEAEAQAQPEAVEAEAEAETVNEADEAVEADVTTDVVAEVEAEAVDVAEMVEVAALSADDRNQFVKRFGKEKAAVFIFDGKSYVSSLEEAFDEAVQQLSSLQKQLEQANEQLSAQGGQSEPIHFAKSEEPKKTWADVIKVK